VPLRPLIESRASRAAPPAATAAKSRRCARDRAAFAVVLFVAASAASSEGAAFCRTTTSGRQPIIDQCPTEGTPLQWPASCAALSLDTTVLPVDWPRARLDAELQSSLDRWNNLSCPSPLSDAGSAARFALVRAVDCADGVRFTRGRAHSNTLSFRPVWADTASFPPGVIAATIVSYDPRTGEILDADIAFNLKSEGNPEGFTFVTEPSADSSARDFSAVLTHELGHVLGIAHSDDRAALMFANYDHSAPRRELRPDDTAAACAVYPPGSGAAACEPMRDHRCAPGCHCAAPGAPRRPKSLATATVALAAALSARRCARSRRRRARES
jgi:hypothetical protein